MYELIIVSHGNFAQSIFETAQMIVGEKTGVQTLGINPGDSIEDFAIEVGTAIEQSLERGALLVLSDITAGSPYNMTVAAMVTHEFHHITGVNLPLLVEILNAREHMTLDEAFDEFLEVGREAVARVNVKHG